MNPFVNCCQADAANRANAIENLTILLFWVRWQLLSLGRSTPSHEEDGWQLRNSETSARGSLACDLVELYGFELLLYFLSFNACQFIIYCTRVVKISHGIK